MEKQDIKIGKWYSMNTYGSDTGIKGKCTDIVDSTIYLKFYWGGPFRSVQETHVGNIIGECRKPSFFSNY